MIKRALIILLAGFTLALPAAPLVAATAIAATPKELLCEGVGGSVSGQGSTADNPSCSTNPDRPTLENKFGKISDTLVYIAGAIAVIVIIIGGFRYITSQGAADQTKQAKDTILYGIIGLVVVILAYAIVRFVSRAIG